MNSPVAPSKVKHTSAPRILVVDDESDLIELIGDAFGRNLDCRLVTVSTVAEARRVMQTQQIELLVTDLHLPDGNGTDLLPTLRKHQPLASAIVITGSPNYDDAVTALRHGAVDFLAKPFNVPDLLDRVRKALYRQSMLLKSENRIERLRDAVRRLNDARKLVTRKVDLLCNDLVSAYSDLSRQLDGVRTTESFRNVITNAKDLEQMLCHAMDWMLRQLGYSNVAIWLAADPGFQLGAYMKYTIAGEEELVEAMRTGLLPTVARESFMHLTGDQVKKQLSEQELKFLHNQTILAAHCTYLGEPLATLVLFRDATKPFSAEDAATLKAISPIFAVTLATMVRQEPNGDPADPDNPFYSGDGNLADEESDYSDKPRKKKDDADWWKRGEQPPF